MLSADPWHSVEGELFVDTFRPIDSASLLTTHRCFRGDFGRLVRARFMAFPSDCDEQYGVDPHVLVSAKLSYSDALFQEKLLSLRVGHLCFCASKFQSLSFSIFLKMGFVELGVLSYPCSAFGLSFFSTGHCYSVAQFVSRLALGNKPNAATLLCIL